MSEEERPERAPPDPDAEYEFTPDENVVFTKLASVMRMVAFMSIAFGAIALLGGFADLFGENEMVDVPRALTSILQGAVFALLGTWLQTASRSFRDIAVTEGRDITNLMNALQDLSKVYSLQAILIAIALVVLGGAMVLSLLGFLGG